MSSEHFKTASIFFAFFDYSRFRRKRQS